MVGGGQGGGRIIRSVNLLNVRPRLNQIEISRVPIGHSVGGNENYFPVRCGNLAYTIVWRSIPDDQSTTISRHDDLVLRVVHHPDGAVLNLGNCRRTGYGKVGKQEKPFHLVLQGGDWTSVVGDGNGGAMLQDFSIFIKAVASRFATR